MGDWNRLGLTSHRINGRHLQSSLSRSAQITSWILCLCKQEWGNHFLKGTEWADEQYDQWHKDRSTPLVRVVQSTYYHSSLRLITAAFDIYEIDNGGNEGVPRRPSKQTLETVFETSRVEEVIMFILDHGKLHSARTSDTVGKGNQPLLSLVLTLADRRGNRGLQSGIANKMHGSNFKGSSH